MLEAALRGGYPMMAGIWGIVANMLLVAALEVGDPVLAFVHVKTYNFFGDAGRGEFRRLHASSLRLFAGGYVSFW